MSVLEKKNCSIHFHNFDDIPSDKDVEITVAVYGNKSMAISLKPRENSVLWTRRFTVKCGVCREPELVMMYDSLFVFDEAVFVKVDDTYYSTEIILPDDWKGLNV